MKKFILNLSLIALLLSSCTSTGDKEGSKETTSSEEEASFATSTEYSKEESSYYISTSSQESYETSDDSVVSSEDSISASEESHISYEDSVDNTPKQDLTEITSQIASIKDNGFNTNISDSSGAEALSALESYLKDSGYGFFYCDLEYNGYVSYGCGKDFKTASTSKLHYIKYLSVKADNGEIDLNETKLYEERHKESGSGVMKSMAAGSRFSIATLMDYVLRYSDNIAYSMLIERFGLEDYLKAVASLGVDYYTYNGYTNCTASEMAALLYDVASYKGAGLALMKNAGCNASYNYQIGAELKEYEVLQKYGAIKPGNVAYHDIAVVYAPHPYILVIYTTIDYDSAGKNIPFRTIARLTNDLNRALYGE